jgi:hypothetical protein
MGVGAHLEGDLLVVELSGFDKVLSLKARLEVPRAVVTSVQAQDRESVERLPGRWLRLPGTYVPSAVHHGSYGLRPNRDFWAVYRQERVLVVKLDGWDYRRLVLGVAEPDRVAAELSPRVG